MAPKNVGLLQASENQRGLFQKWMHLYPTNKFDQNHIQNFQQFPLLADHDLHGN
jgi:hypothetical protein